MVNSEGYGRHGHSRQAGPWQTGFSVSFVWLVGDRPKLTSQEFRKWRKSEAGRSQKIVMKTHDQIKLSVLYQTFVMLKGYTCTRSCICQSTKRSVMITNVLAEYKIKKKKSQILFNSILRLMHYMFFQKSWNFFGEMQKFFRLHLWSW